MRKFCKKGFLIVLIIQILCLFGCSSNAVSKASGEQDDLAMDFSNTADINENQSYWNVIGNHCFAKGDDGYYSAQLVKGSFKLSYISDVDFSVIPLCGKADCNHNDLNCNAFISACQNNSIWRYKDKLYVIKNDAGKAILMSMNLDGTNRNNLFEIGASDSQNAYNLTFGNNCVYISTRMGNIGLENGTEEILRKRSLDGKIDVNIYSSSEENTVIEGVKCYGDFVFFTVKSIAYNEENGKKETVSKGLYYSKIDSDSCKVFMDGNISDFCVDEKNNNMYIYQIGDGLYKYSLADKSKVKIFEADTRTFLCQLSFNDEFLMMSNERWSAFARLKEVTPALWIFDRDGNIINQIETKAYATSFGDSNTLMFDYSGKVGYIQFEDIETCDEWTWIE